VRGGSLAEDLRRYKSDRAAGAPEAAARLRESLAAFLRDKGDALWREAGMNAGPTAVAVVPTGQGRPGAHPLVGMVLSCIALPLVRLSTAPEEIHARGVNPRWVRVGDPVAGGDVLVVDDTWVSGGSAQSTAAALKLAGARHVAVVVLGRHVNPADPRSAAFLPVAAALGDAAPSARKPGPRPTR
jgi:phosphoribosylpyrophosphate synthetase